jgi:glycosyltransferase involved in cell wall biosynthesis
MAGPLVTVICPTYHCPTLLPFALRSVLHQDLTDIEVRVIGDGCTDGSEAVVAGLNDPRLHWTNLPRNTGSQTEPNNEGLRQARGRYVAFIGHDDLWFPWHLSRLVAHLEQTGADLVHDLVAFVGPTGIDSIIGPPHGRTDYERVFVPPSTWLHRRELAAAVGGWRPPEALSWAIDFDFTHRVAQAGRPISFLPSLGVLKFHSVAWKFYSRQGDPPQQPWLEDILKSPVETHARVLAEVAARCAPMFQDQDKKPFGVACAEAGDALRTAAKAAVRDLVSWYGRDRWPLGPLLRRRWRRLRSRQRVHRGLPPL